MTRLINPIPLFLDRRGALLDAGYVYVGAVNGNPMTDPVQCYWDAAHTIPAAQPLRTMGGRIVRVTSPSQVYLAQDDFSILIQDADQQQVDYAGTTNLSQVEYQPLDSDLTAIASLSTTAYGRMLLTLANQAALKAATGIPDPLPAVGGAVSGAITRAGAGVHLYYADSAMVSGRVYVTGPDASDPTSKPGDLWAKTSA